ncbi:SpaH/EbpB family LPXTG-anchored major pilin [Leucobacter sp. USHLN153]|uniref:SpaH/EbpB family LPXTG-anchored major pilin n=1 Tax=Leucobacter sp. USHLN153 TaxID=3081268 RepID=UPI00301A6350
MSHMKRSRVKAALAGVAAAAVALVGLGLTSSAASAAPLGVGNPQLDKATTLSVYKLVQPGSATALPNNGTEITNLPADIKRVEGVEFVVNQVDIDLSDWNVWQTLDQLDPKTVPLKPESATTKWSETTDSNGLAKFNFPGAGVFLVTEKVSTTAKVGGVDTTVQISKPFIVVLPSYDPSDKNKWMYDVYAYPKGGTSDIEKTVTEPGFAGLGSTLSWNITAAVPTLAANQTLDAFSISDRLEEGLTFDKVRDVKLDDAPLTSPADYSVTESNGVVTVTFVPASLLPGGGELTFSIDSTVVSVPDTGIIPNKEYKSTWTIDGDTGKTGPPPPVNSYWGVIGIKKYDLEDEAKVLQGAVFSVYASEDDAKANKNPISVDGKTTFTSDENGYVMIPGLSLGTTTSRDYYIAEVEAPAGYLLRSTPVKVPVTAGSVAEFELAAKYTPFSNEKPIYPNLPLTGGQGTMLITGAGLVLVAGATFVAMRSRRKAAALA